MYCCSSRIIQVTSGALPFTFSVTAGDSAYNLGAGVDTGPIVISSGDIVHFFSLNTIDFQVIPGSANVYAEARIDPNPLNAITVSSAGLFAPGAGSGLNIYNSDGTITDPIRIATVGNSWLRFIANNGTFLGEHSIEGFGIADSIQNLATNETNRLDVGTTNNTLRSINPGTSEDAWVRTSVNTGNPFVNIQATDGLRQSIIETSAGLTTQNIFISTDGVNNRTELVQDNDSFNFRNTLPGPFTIQLNGDPGVAGEVLTSNGPTASPTWEPITVNLTNQTFNSNTIWDFLNNDWTVNNVDNWTVDSNTINFNAPVICFTGITQNDALTRILVQDAGGCLAWRDVASLPSGGGFGSTTLTNNVVVDASNFDVQFINVDEFEIDANVFEVNSPSICFTGITQNDTLTRFLVQDAGGCISWRDASTVIGGMSFNVTGNSGSQTITNGNTLNLNGVGLIGTAAVATDQVDISLTGGANGQIITTVAGVPTWGFPADIINNVTFTSPVNWDFGNNDWNVTNVNDINIDSSTFNLNAPIICLTGITQNDTLTRFLVQDVGGCVSWRDAATIVGDSDWLTIQTNNPELNFINNAYRAGGIGVIGRPHGVTFPFDTNDLIFDMEVAGGNTNTIGANAAYGGQASFQLLTNNGEPSLYQSAISIGNTVGTTPLGGGSPALFNLGGVGNRNLVISHVGSAVIDAGAVPAMQLYGNSNTSYGASVIISDMQDAGASALPQTMDHGGGNFNIPLLYLNSTEDAPVIYLRNDNPVLSNKGGGIVFENTLTQSKGVIGHGMDVTFPGLLPSTIADSMFMGVGAVGANDSHIAVTAGGGAAISNGGALVTTTTEDLYVGGTFNLIRFANYPNTRDDSGSDTPINFIYSDASGNLKSTGITNILGPDILIGVGGKVMTFEGDIDVQGQIDPNSIAFSTGLTGTYNAATFGGYGLFPISAAEQRTIFVAPAINSAAAFEVRRADKITDVFSVDTLGNNIIISDYPNTRNNSGVDVPTNFLYTNAAGALRSAPTSILAGGSGTVTSVSQSPVCPVVTTGFSQSPLQSITTGTTTAILNMREEKAKQFVSMANAGATQTGLNVAGVFPLGQHFILTQNNPSSCRPALWTIEFEMIMTFYYNTRFDIEFDFRLNILAGTGMPSLVNYYYENIRIPAQTATDQIERRSIRIPVFLSNRSGVPVPVGGASPDIRIEPQFTVITPNTHPSTTPTAFVSKLTHLGFEFGNPAFSSGGREFVWETI
jgi:hypothetical protein